MPLFWRKREEPEAQIRRRVNPPKIVAISFLIAILFGSLLLSLPFASSSGRGIAYIDALFTSTSATCVTGLVVKDTGKDFSLFGQIVIVLLIQVGGLGIMTMSTFFLLLFGRRISLRDSITIRLSFGETGARNTSQVIRSAVLLTFTIELIGAAILFWRFHWGAEALGMGKAAYYGVFHSVAAFCNAGFSLYSTNLMGKEWPVAMTVAALLVLGGIGFVVIYNVLNLRFWKKDRLARGRLSLQSKAVLSSTAALIGIGFVLFFILEWNAGMAGQSFGERVVNSFFCSVTPRTAGFNTIDYAKMSSPGILLSMFLMFIGASPGSTGGGIKTCTFVLLLATAYAIMRGRESVVLFRRTIPARVVQQAIAVALISLLLVAVAAIALSISERGGKGWAPCEAGYAARTTFEVFSAFGTVGLSTGITPYLSVVGKVILILTMYAGRVGPLTLALIVAGREPAPAVEYPEETTMIG
jgi:trk system potassium uptake protein TrkH